MKSLAEIAGLPIAAEPKSGRLRFGPELPAVEPVVRRLAELREELADPAAPGPEELYSIYRDVGLPAGRERLHSHGLRYDITVMPPLMVGREYNKTAGQYQSAAPGGEATYPVVYEVLRGTALWLIQQSAPPYAAVHDLAVLEVSAGEKVIIPPGYGQVTINLGPGALVISSLAARACVPVSQPYRDRRGGACYCIRDDDGEPVFVENPRYQGLPDLRMLPAMENPAAGLRDGVPLYAAAVAEPERFRYLTEPQPFLYLMDLPELDEADEDDED